MKKAFLTLFLMLSVISALCETVVSVPLFLSIKYVTAMGDDINTGVHTRPKSPVQIPEVWQDGHTLYFDAAIEGCTVLLLGGDENVIFSDSIDENETSLTFPSTLTGTYELQIIRGSITFYCEIEL